MKLAAMEGLYRGQSGNGLVFIGIPEPGKRPGDGKKDFALKIEIPRMLSMLGYRDGNAFVPGVEDLLQGGFKPGYQNTPAAEKEKAFSVEEKIMHGKTAIAALAEFKKAKKAGDTLMASKADSALKANFAWFGYGYLNSPESVVPNVPLTFYSFRVMVVLGFYFIFLFIILLYYLNNEELEKKRWLLWLSIWTIPLVYLASQAGWVVAEVGRQPWVIQDLLPTVAAVSMIDSTSVQITFCLFATIFTALLIAEIMIMTRQIKLGPKDGGTR